MPGSIPRTILCIALPAPILLGLFAATALAQRDDPTIKIGLTHNIANGANYTLEETATGTEVSNSDPMVGTGLFVEWIVMERIGLELSGTVVPLERSYDLESGGTTVSSVTEQAHAKVSIVEMPKRPAQ